MRSAVSRRAAAVTLALAALAVAAPGATADTTYDTVGGLTYVSDETPSIIAPGASALTIAQCPDQTKLIAGGARIPGFGADAHLHGMFPTTTEGDTGGFGLFFWNANGPDKTAIAHATCTTGPRSPFRPGSGETESAPDSVAVKASCKHRESVSGGGVFIGGGAINEAFVNSSYPIDGGDADNKPDDGWKGRVQNRAGLGKSVTAYAICSERSWLYRQGKQDVFADEDAGHLFGCHPGEHLVSGGAKLTGSAGDTVLRALSPFDAGDSDNAPDDGFDINIANDGDDRKMKLTAICKP